MRCKRKRPLGGTRRPLVKLMTIRSKNSGTGRTQSSAGARPFAEEARQRLIAEHPAGLSFKVEWPTWSAARTKELEEERYRSVLERPLPKRSGRSVSEETGRVVKAEAFRRLTGVGSMRSMSERFFLDKQPTERYDRYRAIVAQHATKIEQFLDELKKQHSW